MNCEGVVGLFVLCGWECVEWCVVVWVCMYCVWCWYMMDDVCCYLFWGCVFCNWSFLCNVY